VISVSPDVGKNRLLLTLQGRPDVAELVRAEPDLVATLARLQPPFDVLSDVRELESLDDLPPDELTRLVGLIIARGVRRTVRVVGRAAGGAVHMERVARPLGLQARLAFSLEEAEQVLAAPSTRAPRR
jgi:hypothetical protein